MAAATAPKQAGGYRPTRGAFSDVLARPLPNGWRLELSNELYLDPKGTA